MLRYCSKEEFNNYIDFAFELAMDLSKSGYPTYCDGIKTREMFVERSLKAFERYTEQMLLFVYEGEVQGLIQYYWIPEDHYLSTIIFNMNKATEQALSEFLSFVSERFKGYDLFLGFPAENQSAVNYLVSQGLECIENDYNNTAFLEKCGMIPKNSTIFQVGKESYESFRKIHCQIEGDMYWNSERILADLDNWSIFVKENDGEPQGSVYYMNADDGWYEIFGIDMDHGAYDPELFKELLNTALLDANRRNGKVMTFFCDKEYEEFALECGFTCVGNYLCYKAHIE